MCKKYSKKIQKVNICLWFITVLTYHLGIKDLGIKNPELDKYLYKFIELFNKELLKKYWNIIDREKSLDINVIGYIKQLSLKDKIKFLAKWII